MIRKIVFAIVSILVAQVSIAQVMNSGSYSIQNDSINFGGGLSSSTSYTQESTFGEVATGQSSSAAYNIFAGYQQMADVYIAIAAVSDVTLSPSIDGATGGTANGSATITVTTDNDAGYELYIKASSSPALVSGLDFFADYTPVGINPDFSFGIAATEAEFGFSPEGVDVTQEYLDNGSSCNTGVLDTVSACWGPLTTSNELIATRSTENNPSGTATVVRFRAESGSSNMQQAGVYVATTTVTAIPL